MRENRFSRLTHAIADQYGDEIINASGVSDRRSAYAELLEAGTYLIGFAIASAHPREKVKEDVLEQFERVLDAQIANIIDNTVVDSSWPMTERLQ